ncbi:hypothetical protein SLE2022_067180 [Rubroshorea leprosula]
MGLHEGVEDKESIRPSLKRNTAVLEEGKRKPVSEINISSSGTGPEFLQPLRSKPTRYLRAGGEGEYENE